MKRQWEYNSRHGTTDRRRGRSGWGQRGQRWMGDEIRQSLPDRRRRGSSDWGQDGQRWMGDEIRQSLPDHIECNMQPQRTHNRNVHSQSSSGAEGVGERWVAPDMRYSHPGGGGPNMEHGRTDNWVAPNMRYSPPPLPPPLPPLLLPPPNMEHHDVSEVPTHSAIDVATSERESRERIVKGRKRWEEIVNEQNKHNQVMTVQTTEYNKRRDKLKAEEERLDAVNKAKYEAFIEFKRLVSTKTTKRRNALALANSLHKVIRHFWFRRDHKSVWFRYCQKKVAAQRIVIFHCQNNIRRLRETKINAMESLGKSGNVRRLRETKINAMVSLGKYIAYVNAAAAVCDGVFGNTTDNDSDNHADADADDVKAAAAVGSATATNADDDSGAEILMNFRKTSAAVGPSANATTVAAVNTAAAVGNSTDNVDDNYADADADDAKAAAAVGAAPTHVDCKIKDKRILMNRTKTDECMTIEKTTTDKRNTMNCAMMEDRTMEKQLSEYPTMEDHMMNCPTMDDRKTSADVGPSANATVVAAVNTAAAVGNSTDNVDPVPDLEPR